MGAKNGREEEIMSEAIKQKLAAAGLQNQQQ
jgi:hypothetical protein